MKIIIYKILDAQLWRAAKKSGCFKGAPVDLEDDFIHFSTKEQLKETADKYFAGCDDLLLVAVSAEALGADLKWEPARGGALFPHLYADLPIEKVLWVKPLPWLKEKGAHSFPELDA